MIRQDMLMRAIEQLAAMVARALGFVASEQYEEALDAVREGKGALPIVPGMVDSLEPEALFQLLGADHCKALVSLWRAEAEALDGLNKPARAARVSARAQTLERLLPAPATFGDHAPKTAPRSGKREL